MRRDFVGVSIKSGTRYPARFLGLAISTAGVIVAASLLPGAAEAQDCYSSSVLAPTPFLGNNGEIVKLADGSLWEVKYEYEYMYEYYPAAVVCPSRGILVVKNKELTVVALAGSPVQGPAPSNPSLSFPSGGRPSSELVASALIESRLEGEFEGYEAGNIYRLTNGQLWEQISARYRYRYWYRPEVTIVQRDGQYRMKIEPLDDWITVVQLGGISAPAASTNAALSELDLAQLEGAVIIASDGRRLGTITTNCVSAEALCNPFATYGNEFNSSSIYNDFGRYGSEFSSVSPFNEFSSTPPEIYKDGRFLAYLTKNATKTPRVDPDWLTAMLNN